MEIKDIEYGAKVRMYKNALLKKEASDSLLEKEQLKLELKKKKENIREQELLIEDLQHKITALSDDSVENLDDSSSTLSKRIVKLETLLSEREFKIKNLTSMVDKLENQLTDTVEKIAKLEEELVSRPDVSSNSEVDVDQLNIILGKISRMKTPKSILEQKIDEYGKKMKDLHRENGLLHAQLDLLYSKLGDLDFSED